MEWLTKWLGLQGPTANPDLKIVEALRDDTDRLDKVAAGLGAEALRYIVTGENDSVLLVLKKHGQQVAAALNRQAWNEKGHWIKGRWDYLVAAPTWRPDILRRYGQVLAIDLGTRRYPPLPGTNRAPDWFRIIVSEHGDARRTLANLHQHTKPGGQAVNPLTVERLKDLLRQGEDNLFPHIDLAFEVTDTFLSQYVTHSSPRGCPVSMNSCAQIPSLDVRRFRLFGQTGVPTACALWHAEV